LNQFDHLFFFGDLNYRIDLPESLFFERHIQLPAPASDPTLPKLQFEASIERKNFLKMLRDADQLDGERKAGRAFYDFEEAENFDFAPTYRFKRSSTPRKIGERRTYTPNRMPSYCDRVLWKSLPGAPKLLQTLLTSIDDVPELDTSDHAPIVATFAFKRSYTMKTPQDRRNVLVFEDILSASGAPGLAPFHFRKPARCALRFFGRFLEGRSTDFTKSAQCLFPKWAPTDIPPIVVSTTALRALRKSALSIQLIDDKDRVLGTTVLPLKHICDGQPWPFKVFFTHRGLTSGELKGTLRARGPAFQPPESPSSRRTASPPPLPSRQQVIVPPLPPYMLNEEPLLPLAPLRNASVNFGLAELPNSPPHKPTLLTRAVFPEARQISNQQQQRPPQRDHFNNSSSSEATPEDQVPARLHHSSPPPPPPR